MDGVFRILQLYIAGFEIGFVLHNKVLFCARGLPVAEEPRPEVPYRHGGTYLGTGSSYLVKFGKGRGLFANWF